MDFEIWIFLAAFALVGVLFVLFLRKRPKDPGLEPSDFLVENKTPEKTAADSETPELEPALVPRKNAAAPGARPEVTNTAPAAQQIKAPAPWELALKRSREPLLSRLRDALSELTSGEAWNDSHPLWERMEETLLAADLGPAMTERLLDTLKKEFREKPDAETLKQHLREKMLAVFAAVPTRPTPTGVQPFVTILIGVNGAGKTTTAGKLAAQAKNAGKTVVLGAGDTFRAAAVEQLKTWADRVGVECVMPAQGANPAAVAFDTVAAGISRGADEVIIDTAGRLHTKDNLMDELKKVVRVIDKKMPGAPHRTLLVLDATLGQNALAQAKEFTAVVPATGVVLTKLDGSSKGGAAFAVSADLGLPVLFVGVGEGVDDLRPFSPADFVNNLLP